MSVHYTTLQSENGGTLRKYGCIDRPDACDSGVTTPVPDVAYLFEDFIFLSRDGGGGEMCGM